MGVLNTDCNLGAMCYHTLLTVNLTNTSTLFFIHWTTFFESLTSAEHPLDAGGSEGIKQIQFLLTEGMSSGGGHKHTN